MTVQDDERERELVRMFNLAWDPAHQRAGVDATLDVAVDGQRFRLEVEVKSTTGDTVATARDVGMAHIQRWRRMFFVIGFYSRDARRPELQRCLCLSPLDMEPWIASVEGKIAIDFLIARRSSSRLQLDDLHAVCGPQSSYSIEDARRLHKQQWSSAEYEAALDMVENGLPRISPAMMLRILQLRANYIAERGATLNNPHVTKSHLRPFFDTDREVVGNAWAESIRRLAEGFIRQYPGHAAVTAV